MIRKTLKNEFNVILIKPKIPNAFGGYKLSGTLIDYYNKSHNYLEAVTVLNKLLLALKDVMKKENSMPKIVATSLVADINGLVNKFLDNQELNDNMLLLSEHKKTFLNLVTSYHSLSEWFEESEKLTKASEVWGKASTKKSIACTFNN